MKKLFTLTFLSAIFSIASYAIPSFVPSSGNICVGTTLYIYDTLSGGIWSSSNPAVATIGTSTGILTGVSAGVTTVTYTVGSSYTTGSFTVSPAPAAITGASSVCATSSITLADATPGGIWTSSSSGIATVGSASGVVTGVAAGVATISYSMPGGCAVTKLVTVNTTPMGYISGPHTVCVGGTITLMDSTGLGGGVWSSAGTTIATIGSSTGVVTGVSTGTVTISYTTTSACGSVSSTYSITVTSTTSPGTITGPASVAVGGTITLYDGVTGGTWTSGSTGVATIGSSSGIVTGVAVGSAPITYTVTGCGGPASTTTTISVTALDGISGHVIFSSPFLGPVKIWLIKYNSSTLMLTAADSISAMCSGTSLYYQFTGLATDSFRIKAAAFDSSFLTTGFIPTYHNSSFYWHSANVVYHTSGTSDINKDINMAVGTITSGPGFIAGNVTTGANKGTTGSSPVAGLKMVVINTTTSQVIASAITDASGNYSFSNLPVGQTYTVFPDSLNYLTTAYSSISLTTGAPSMTAASFIQHTISKTITPILTGTGNIAPTISSVTAFPNPTDGKLCIRWQAIASETASASITDITGKEVYHAAINMSAGSGMHQFDLSAMPGGVYFVNVRSATINYNNKIQVQH